MWIEEFVRESVARKKSEKLKRSMLQSQMGVLGLGLARGSHSDDFDAETVSESDGTVSDLLPGRKSIQSVDNALDMELTSIARKPFGMNSSRISSSSSASGHFNEARLQSPGIAGIIDPDAEKSEPLHLKHLPKSLRNSSVGSTTPVGTPSPFSKLSFHGSR